jgi:hypothetical protein
LVTFSTFQQTHGDPHAIDLKKTPSGCLRAWKLHPTPEYVTQGYSMSNYTGILWGSYLGFMEKSSINNGDDMGIFPPVSSNMASSEIPEPNGGL